MDESLQSIKFANSISGRTPAAKTHATPLPDSKVACGLQLHRTKCGEIIRNILGPHFKTTLREDIGDTSSTATSQQIFQYKNIWVSLSDTLEFP